MRTTFHPHIHFVAACIALSSCGDRARSNASTSSLPSPPPAPPTVSAVVAPHPQTPRIASSAAPPLELVSTDQVQGTPAFREKVDALASANAVEGPYLGVAARRSKVYADYQALRAASTPAQRVALLRHKSPVVRAYLVEDVIESRAFKAADVTPLLADATRVEKREGCMISGDTIAEETIEALCKQRDLPASQEALLAATRAPWLTMPRFHALRCLDPAQAAEARAVLSAALGKADQPSDVILAAIDASPAAGVAACHDLLAPLAAHADANVRMRVAERLGSCPDARALPLVERLMSDDKRGVAIAAKRAYAGRTDADAIRVRALFGDSDVEKGIVFSLASSDNPAILDIYVEQLAKIESPTDGQVHTVGMRKPSAAYTAAMRRVATFTHSHFSKPTFRTQALGYLAAQADPESLDLFKKGLTGSNQHERAAAARGVAALADRSSIPALEALLADESESVVLAAARALAALGSRSSADKIKDAPFYKHPRQHDELAAIEAAVRAGKPAPASSAPR